MEFSDTTYQLGLDGFIWWMGVVESVDTDLLTVGRAKVRIFNWHTADINTLPTSDLPWSYPLLPVSHGTNVPNYRCGDWVVGFFLDGRTGQQPIVMGILPSIAQS